MHTCIRTCIHDSDIDSDSDDDSDSDNDNDSDNDRIHQSPSNPDVVVVQGAFAIHFISSDAGIRMLYGRFPKFHPVFLGRDPGTLKSDIVSKKHPQLICSDLRLSNRKFED